MRNLVFTLILGSIFRIPGSRVYALGYKQAFVMKLIWTVQYGSRKDVLKLEYMLMTHTKKPHNCVVFVLLCELTRFVIL